MSDNERRDEQILRERNLRDAAIGRRAEAVGDGEMAPVLRRWINASVLPAAIRLRKAAHATLAGDTDGISGALDTEAFGLIEFAGRSADLHTLLGWTVRGSSPGRSLVLDHSTYAEDLVLVTIATALRGIIGRRKGSNQLTLNAAVAKIADALRETVLGQWITTVQGASAMAKVEAPAGQSWKRGYKLDEIAGLLAGQVQPQLESEERGEVDLETVGARKVVRVIDPRNQRERRLDLRPPSREDWEVLRLARTVRGEADAYRSTWATFALLILCAVQRELGWFGIEKKKTKTGRRGYKSKVLILSAQAEKLLSKDAEQWASYAWPHAPMLCPPDDDGGYLTVKERAVRAVRSVPGSETRAEGTWQWRTATDVLARTPWHVNTDLLNFTAEHGLLDLTSAWDAMMVAEHRRLAVDTFWLPVFMDFRGRVYPRTSFVSYQGADIQKALIRFKRGRDLPAPEKAVAMYATSLTSLDKRGEEERLDWWRSYREDTSDQAILDLITAEPGDAHSLAALMLANRADVLDAIPCRIDGTCNGIQHLSAMFRDEAAAPYVNLTDAPLPRDIYAEVAGHLERRLRKVYAKPWANRLLNTVTINRKVTKRSVMVLPYGGTLKAIEEYLSEAFRDQELDPAPWRECLWKVDGQWVPDHVAREADYLAFSYRELVDHPLFKADVRAASKILWAAIQDTLPRAMMAMEALRKIGGKIGPNILEWAVGPETDGLFIRQGRGKASMSRIRMKGLHLPESVRSLGIVVGRHEVDPSAHRSGIVANFIHSHDADHLARTMRMFRESGGHEFAAVHDSYWSRPSDAHILAACARGAFLEKYGVEDFHPLEQCVTITDPKTGAMEFAGTWRTLAQEVGAVWPEVGEWDPKEILTSRWFFS